MHHYRWTNCCEHVCARPTLLTGPSMLPTYTYLDLILIHVLISGVYILNELHEVESQFYVVYDGLRRISLYFPPYCEKCLDVLICAKYYRMQLLSRWGRFDWAGNVLSSANSWHVSCEGHVDSGDSYLLTLLIPHLESHPVNRFVCRLFHELYCLLPICIFDPSIKPPLARDHFIKTFE